ncbi:hypothetical protein EG329_000544 [Mollisiaceae sp. DMI_Dod_QoI]|nr:hypothetical protein EG329_000544 [Helotiales sp. DMI_Dod_QoI]
MLSNLQDETPNPSQTEQTYDSHELNVTTSPTPISTMIVSQISLPSDSVSTKFLEVPCDELSPQSLSETVTLNGDADNITPGLGVISKEDTIPGRDLADTLRNIIYHQQNDPSSENGLNDTSCEEAEGEREQEKQEAKQETKADVKEELMNKLIEVFGSDRMSDLALAIKDKLDKCQSQGMDMKLARVDIVLPQDSPHCPDNSGFDPHHSPSDSDISLPRGLSLNSLRWHQHQRRRLHRKEGSSSKKLTLAKQEVARGLERLVGLEQIKDQFRKISSQVEISKNQGIDPTRDRFNVIFQGNPGTVTGKTSLARLFAKHLYSVGILKSMKITETSGCKLASGSHNANQLIQELIGYDPDDGTYSKDGGVLFIDEAYQLTAPHASNAGSQALDIILTEMENHIGHLVVIFAGYDKDMESFFAHNDGLASRIPFKFKFPDFNSDELGQILRTCIERKYSGKMKVADGMNGRYIEIVARRLSRGRNIRGFGNARTVENMLTIISQRQSDRLTRLIENRQTPDCLEFTKEDLIGPNPSEAKNHSETLKKLNDLVGLETVKESANIMVAMIETNYQRELKLLEPHRASLNCVFYGSPGTGKTTVAEMYGRILAELGLLSTSEWVRKNPSDFIGKSVGDSEANTRAILNATKGKVLIIDEAYMFHPGDGVTSQQDSFRAAVVDTLVAEVQGIPGDDRCVILLGYQDKMDTMFRNVNEGLARRFQTHVHFPNYTVDQLIQILNLKMQDQNLKATPAALEVAKDIFTRALQRPDFSNGGEVNSCLQTALKNSRKRQLQLPVSERRCDSDLEPQDFDPDYIRNKTAFTNCRDALQLDVDTSVIDVLERYREQIQATYQRGIDPRGFIHTNFIFKGGPNVGMRRTAQYIAILYYEIGFLATTDMVTCSAGDLVGRYVGHTGPITRAQLEKGLGKVLFVSGADHLVGGDYTNEAVKTFTQQLMLPKYDRKMIIILAGNETKMDKLLEQNPEFGRHFPIETEITFANLKPDILLARLQNELSLKGVTLSLQQGTSEYGTILKLMKALSTCPSWSNTHSVKTLAVDMVRALDETVPSEERAKPTFVWPDLLSTEQAISSMENRLKLLIGNRNKSRRMVPKPSTAPTSPPLATNQNPPNTGTASAPLHADASKTKVTTATATATAPLQADASKTKVNTATKTAVVDKKKDNVQEVLRNMGTCENGYEWKKVTDGWQCAGGMHKVSDAEVANRMSS